MKTKLYTSKNQNTEFFKREFLWRIAIYHNSEFFLVHLKTAKSQNFIMYLVIFCVSLSLRELSEMRGVESDDWKVFLWRIHMESLKFKGTKEEFRGKNYVYL